MKKKKKKKKKKRRHEPAHIRSLEPSSPAPREQQAEEGATDTLIRRNHRCGSAGL